MEDEEALESWALIRQLADTIKDKIHNFFANGVVSSGIVVGSIFLASDQLFRMEELAIGSSSNLINHSGFKIDKDSPDRKKGSLFVTTYYFLVGSIKCQILYFWLVRGSNISTTSDSNACH